uniref:Uncharacterized protein n=1 Tax=Micrurus corallinus TaxID=54390 RepID=A0A2D4G885_MICCO
MDVHRLGFLKIALLQPGALQVCWDFKIQNSYSTESNTFLQFSKFSFGIVPREHTCLEVTNLNVYYQNKTKNNQPSKKCPIYSVPIPSQEHTWCPRKGLWH